MHLASHRHLNAALGLALALAATPSWSWELVSREDIARDRQAEASQGALLNPQAKAFQPNAPQIEVRQPSRLDGVKAPFPIQLSFRSSDGAELDLKSFKVLYGFLKLDITSRLLEKARLNADGLMLEDAAIPSGQHRLRVQLKDSKGREGELDVTLKVL